ncbi:MAG: FMN-binding protein, partial [Bdellovibrionales bacterium]|nr:FMN-binding protein [Bdellovibrionales bacterium]
GTVRSTIILAFHEPLDYLPTASWLNQFTDRALSDKLKLSGDISGILGSTLSARAVTRGVRRVMAIHQVLRIDGELQREYEPSSEADALVVASAQKGS